MATEIERRFVVTQSLDFLRGHTPQKIKQGYIHAQGPTTRIRIIDEKDALFTLKGYKRGLVTPEFEHGHALADGLELLEMCGKRVIHKQRYHVEHEGHVWHVDVFDKKLEGLVIAEIELGAANEAFAKPSWLGMEITFKKGLSNRSLAKQQRFPKKLKCRAK